jgi:predicted metalloprotease with PDZ domain
MPPEHPDPSVPVHRAGARRCSRRRWLAAAAASVVARAVKADDEQPVIVTQPVPGAQIELQFTPDFGDEQRERARQWVVSSAEAVSSYFGRFPVPQLELLLQGSDGSGVVNGATFGEPSLHTRVRLGRDTTAAQYHDDRVLVHEMVHLAVPRVPRAQRWLHEGIATYVESLARARAGLIDAAIVWRGWMRQMPLGQPGPGDAGLDHTPTWGRVYWGGAMFCLLADVRMRQRGTAARGLQQGLQGVLQAGGDYRVAWPAQRILATADAAVGSTTLTDLYRDLKDTASTIDLATLWRELGVEGEQLRDDAPLAAARRAILA